MFGRPPQRTPRDVVPIANRERQLDADIREWVDRRAELLAESYYADYERDDEHGDYDEAKHNLLTDEGWKWYGKGSERTVACLGRTWDGKPIYDDLSGVVIKFNPWLRLGEFMDEEPDILKVSESGNLHEIAVWAYACDHDDTKWFASLLDYSERGDWVAQKYVIPVYRHRQPVFANAEIDYLSDRQHGAGLTTDLRERLQDRGYDPHIKDGNVGFDMDTGNPVLIDFGAHVYVDEFEDAEALTAYVADH